MIINFETKGTAYHNLTGKFPHKQPRGNKYILVNHYNDSNTILTEQFKNRQAAEIKCT